MVWHEGAERKMHRLMVVDDEPGLRTMIADYLRRHGFAVDAAADGAELDACL